MEVIKPNKIWEKEVYKLYLNVIPGSQKDM